MKYTGQLHKMVSEYENPITYYLSLDDDILMMNQLIYKKICIKHIGYKCFNCSEDREILSQGYCYVCFNKVPQTNASIMKPELSKAHLGIAEKDIVWEQELQLQPHIVYLANTGSLKVGVTRKKQLPTRWIDQGATEAVKIIEVENRYLAGIAEVALAKYIADKTNYRKMLSETIEYIDLVAWKHKLITHLPHEVKDAIVNDDITILHYPTSSIPKIIKTVNLKKEILSEGILIGIKGQYLIFENGLALNIRSHEGFVVEIEIK